MVFCLAGLDAFRLPRHLGIVRWVWRVSKVMVAFVALRPFQQWSDRHWLNGVPAGMEITKISETRRHCVHCEICSNNLGEFFPGNWRGNSSQFRRSNAVRTQNSAVAGILIEVDK